MKLLKRYKNLILLVAAIIVAICIIASDPLGTAVKHRHEREAIRNRIAIEQAETEKRIAIIKAEKEAELIRIHQSLGNVETEDVVGIYSAGN